VSSGTQYIPGNTTSLDKQRLRIRSLLKEFNFTDLFIEELGWDYTKAMLFKVDIQQQTYTLAPLVEKARFIVYQCILPDHILHTEEKTLNIIEKVLTKEAVYEHIIIFTDIAYKNQIWMWVQREPKRAIKRHREVYNIEQSGEHLAQILQVITFDLNEEGKIDISTVTERVGRAFEVNHVEKGFYTKFQEKRKDFVQAIQGISSSSDKQWYGTLMLTRLMLIYFIQAKGFLNDDLNYLHTQLRKMQQEKAKNNFLSFYHDFLLHLFQRGFAEEERKRSPEIEQKLGKIPFLNGGLFEENELERRLEIDIPDEAFEQLFTFLDKNSWHLDSRPLKRDNEINPDVLGYIFEQFVNQEESDTGTYYTKEDITEYIAKNTIIPALFHAIERKYPQAFESNSIIWKLLRDNPDRYIYGSIKKGYNQPLPLTIHNSIFNKSRNVLYTIPAPEGYAHPTETWGEVIDRHKHYDKIYALLKDGKVTSIDELITYNLDIIQFVTTIITTTEDVELLGNIYQTIVGRNNIHEPAFSILDPMCGSGAFLLAALNVLAQLYEACIIRMDSIVTEFLSSKTIDKYFNYKHATNEERILNYISSFKDIINEVKAHTNPSFFILKSIIVNNLYGVDLTKEASEICRLRLFLKLLAQIDRYEDLRPLPNVDFNIYTGNSLVGFTSMEEVRTAIIDLRDALISTQELAEIEHLVQEIEHDTEIFRRIERPLTPDHEVVIQHKDKLKRKLDALNKKLTPYLATKYGIDTFDINNKKRYKESLESWQQSHSPFHWFSEFYKIINKGGFNVIISNPPYFELSKLKDRYTLKGLELLSTGNIYAVSIEKFITLLSQDGHMGTIVPLSSISTQRMLPLMRLLSNQLTMHISNFAVRPGKLFVGVDMNLTILIGEKEWRAANRLAFSTAYMRWNEENRNILFDMIRYSPTKLNIAANAYPKLGNKTALNLLEKISHNTTIARFFIRTNSIPLYYHSGGRYFRKCIRKKLSNEYKEIRITKEMEHATICLLSSSFYYWLWVTFSDCYHVTKGDIDMLPVPDSFATDTRFEKLAERLLADLEEHALIRKRTRADGSQKEEVNYYVGKSKHILDEIDRVLAEHYGFTEEELDFIINYDIKYRMGKGHDEGDIEE
jgi:hypothetical protein